MTSEKDAERGLVEDAAGPSGRPCAADRLPSVGEWYWVGDADEIRWLGCVTRVGSNYAKLIGPSESGRGHHVTRIHFRDFAERCVPEPAATAVIVGKIAEQRTIIADATRQISAIAGRLMLGEPGPGDEAKALAVHDGRSMDGYKKDLVHARDVGMPELRKKIEEAAEVMENWMLAEAISMEAHKEVYEAQLELVKKRVKP